MISHDKRFIFTHIPKTAGTSVSAVLSQHGVSLQGRRNYDSIYFKHFEASRLQSELGDAYEDYFRFSFVRSPWTWLVSNYEFNRGLHRPYVRGTRYGVSGLVPDWAAGMSFREWLPWWIETFSPSQHALLVDGDGRLLMHEIYRFENLAADFARLCGRLEIAAGPLPHLVGSGGGRAPVDYYDEESRRLVRQHFARDFELFGYPLQP